MEGSLVKINNLTENQIKDCKMPILSEETQDYIKEIIINCWKKNPNERKDIGEILNSFQKDKKIEEKFEAFNTKIDLNEKDKKELNKLSEKIESSIVNFNKLDISRFKILKKVGEGAFAIIYKATLKKEKIKVKKILLKNKKTNLRTVGDEDSDEIYEDSDDSLENNENIFGLNNLTENFFALKLLNNDFSEKNFESVEFKRCLKEISIQLQLSNEKNIRKVKGYSIFKDSFGKIKLCLILEFIEGEDLFSLLKVKFFFFLFLNNNLFNN
jgi:hypothetical protein